MKVNEFLFIDSFEWTHRGWRIRPLTFLCKVCLLHSSQLEYVTLIFAMWNLITFPRDTNFSWVFQTYCRKQKLKNSFFLYREI